MALVDEDPPITLPRAHSTLRPPTLSSGSQKYIQSWRRSVRILPQPSGMWIMGSRSQPPASSSSTEHPGSALSRLASTQPADPAPTMM
jgi:hypothetical protein